VLVVPLRDDSQFLRLAFGSDENLTQGTRRGRPVAVIVLQDGTELHFFEFLDSDDDFSSEDDERYVKKLKAEESDS